MKFECDSCHAQYMIADEKVGSRGVKVKCKRCAHVIIVRPAEANAGAETPAPVDDAAGPVPASPSSFSLPAMPDDGAPPPLAAATDEGGTHPFASEDDDEATLHAPPPFGMTGEANATGAVGETAVGPRPEGLSSLDAPSEPNDGDDTELGPPALDSEPGGDRSLDENEAAPPPAFDAAADEPPAPPSPDEAGMPPVEEPAGADALDEQLAGAFSNMFDPKMVPADIPAPPPLEDEGAGPRGPTVVLDLGEVEKLRRDSVRSEVGPALAEPGADASLDDVRADLDASLDSLGGLSEESAGPSPWGEEAPGAPASMQASQGPSDDASDEPEWHVAIDDEDIGPLTLAEVGEHIAAGRVDRESLVWRSGMGDWEPADEVPQIRALFEKLPLPRIATPPESTAPARTTTGRLDVGSSMPDLAPSPFGGPGASDPFAAVPDLGGEPSWQPHGLTDVYQAANLAEAAAGMATRGTPAPSAPAPGPVVDEEPVAWKPGAASALASLVQEEIKRIDSAPEEALSPPPADDAGIGGFGEASGSEEQPALGGLPPLGPLPPLSGADLAGTQAPAGASGQGFAYAPMSNAGVPAAAAPAPALGGAVPPLGGVPPMPYAPVPPPARPTGLYVGIGAAVVVLLLLTAGVVKIAFFGSPAPAVAEAPPTQAAPPAQPTQAAQAAQAPQPSQPVQPVQPGQPIVAAVTPGTTPPPEAPAAPAESAAQPVAVAPEVPAAQAPAEPVKVAAAEPKRDDKPKVKKETRPARVSKKSRADDRRKSRAEERRKRRARADDAPKKSRAKKDCDPVLDFDCDEKPARRARASRAEKETLSRSDVLLVVRKNLSGVNACLKRHNDKGPVKMEWRIAKSGRTTGVKVLSSKHAGTPVGSCLTKEIKGWKFPSYSGKAPPPVKFPFKLQG